MSQPHLACVRCKQLSNTDPCPRCWCKNTHELLPGDIAVRDALIEDIRKAEAAYDAFWRRLDTKNPRH